MRVATLGAVIVVVVLWASPAAARQQPSLAIAPGSGVYADSQRVDLVILFGDTAGRSIIRGRVLLDDNDVTPIVVGLFRAEALAGGLSFRSPTMPMGIIGLGTHVFEVVLTLSDGSELQAVAVWQVLRSN